MDMVDSALKRLDGGLPRRGMFGLDSSHWRGEKSFSLTQSYRTL